MRANTDQTITQRLLSPTANSGGQEPPIAAPGASQSGDSIQQKASDSAAVTGGGGCARPELYRGAGKDKK